MGDEVVDVRRDQPVQRGARIVVALRTVARHLQQLAPALGEDGAEEIFLAGEDGVDRPHRHAGQARDVLQLGAVEAALGEHLLGRLDDVLAGRRRCAPAAPCPVAFAWPLVPPARFALSARQFD